VDGVCHVFSIGWRPMLEKYKYPDAFCKNLVSKEVLNVDCLTLGG
jgi:hypothetical protein